MKPSIITRVFYRIWQFKQVLFARFDENEWRDAVATLPAAWGVQLNQLRPSEKAHTMRVYNAISKDDKLDDDERQQLLRLALLHDIGKGITRHTLLFKVMKVLLPISGAAHCIAGARFLQKAGADRQTVARVLRHHKGIAGDEMLRKFQYYDDCN